MMLGIVLALVFLFVVSVLDVKTLDLKDGFIPSVLTTSFLVLAFIVGEPSKVLYFGVFGGLMAVLLVDFNVFHGLADLKVLIASAMTLPNFNTVLYFMLLLLLCSLAYKCVVKWKFKDRKNVAFVPVIFVAYIINLLVFV